MKRKGINSNLLFFLESAVCQATGDPHYTVFDGGKADYQGLCTHLLASPCPEEDLGGLTDFTVKFSIIACYFFSDSPRASLLYNSLYNHKICNYHIIFKL